MSTQETDMKSGGCQCGAIRYCAEGFKRPSICHCRMCQKAVGGPFAALVSVQNLSWTRGEPAYFESSNLVRRGFCRDCGTPLTYEFEGDNIDITITSLDDPTDVSPIIQLGTENQLPWCKALTELPTRTSEEEAKAEQVFAAIVSNQHPDHDT